MEKIALEKKDGKTFIFEQKHIDHMKQLYYSGYDLKEIASVYQVSYGTIRNKLAKNNVKFRTRSENKYLMDKKKGISNRIHSVNTKFFEEWSHDMAYVLGFIYADGHVVYRESTEDKKGKYELIFNLIDTDYKHLEKIKKTLGYTGDVKISESKGGKLKTNGEKTKYSSLRINSKDLTKPLNRFKITGKKSFTVVFPEDIPEEYEIDFIRGYFDGDGSVGKHMGDNIRTRFCGANKDFINKIQEVLQKYGLKKKTVASEKRYVLYDISYSTKESIQIYNLFYKNKSCLKLDRKYNVYNELINKK